MAPPGQGLAILARRALEGVYPQAQGCRYGPGPGQDGPYSHIYPYMGIWAHIAIYGVYGPEGLYLDGRHWALEPVLGVYGPKALRAWAPGTPIWDP